MTVWATRPGLVLDDQGQIWECLGPVDRAIADLAVSPIRRSSAMEMLDDWLDAFDPRDEAEWAYRLTVREGGDYGP